MIVEEPPVDSVKLGFTIGRSFGTAVKRNRARRRIRHGMSEAAKSSEVVTTHLLVGASPDALSTSYPELVDHCRCLLEPSQ